MGALDLPEASVKCSADVLAATVKLQNWCASSFPYVCTGEKRVFLNDRVICECGAAVMIEGDKTEPK